eukprot:scpid84547/ scgid10787/ 
MQKSDQSASLLHLHVSNRGVITQLAIFFTNIHCYTLPQDDYGKPTLPQDDYGKPTLPQDDYGKPTLPQDDYGKPTLPTGRRAFENKWRLILRIGGTQRHSTIVVQRQLKYTSIPLGEIKNRGPLECMLQTMT